MTLRLVTLAFLALCCALAAVGCTEPRPLPPNPNRPSVTIVPARRTPAPTPTFTVTPIPTQTPLLTATAVFPAECLGFRNTSVITDDDLLTLYWEYMLSRGRDLWNYAAKAYDRDPENGDQMADLSGAQVLAASRSYWERSAEGRRRCGDLARFLAAEGKMAERFLR